MPVVSKKPVRWVIFYKWTPLRTVTKGQVWVDLRSYIEGFWARDGWSDREFCLVFATREDAERERQEILKAAPDLEGRVFIAPSTRRFWPQGGRPIYEEARFHK